MTRNSRRDDCPAWSPDGTMIAFYRERADRRHSGQIRIKVLGAPGSTRVTVQRYGGCPEWSPDGSTILFRTEPPDEDLYTIGPDGSSLTLVGRGAGGHYDIFVMNADATGIVNITNSDDAMETHPAWSPSADRIAFYRATDELWTMASDGSDPSPVVAVPQRLFDLNSYPLDWQPIP